MGRARGDGRDAGAEEVATPSARGARVVRTVGPGKVVYCPGRSRGQIPLEAVAVQSGAGQRFVFLYEWVRKDERDRLTRLDLADGKVQVLSDLGEDRLDPYVDLVCARNGRVAVKWYGGTVLREPDGRWIPLDGGKRHNAPMAWSPDSRSLIYSSLSEADYQHQQWFATMVATVTSAKGSLRQETLANPDRPIRQAMWGADDSTIYALVLSPTSVYDSSLVSIGWPSREVKTLLTGAIANLDVAEKNGTAVVPMAEGRQYAVWTVQRSEKPKRTPIMISDVPMESRISPNGRYLAAVLGGSWIDKIARERAGDGGVVIYDTADGSEYRVSETVGKRIAEVHWVLEGKALVFTIIPKGGHPGNPDALPYQLWLVRMPWGRSNG